MNAFRLAWRSLRRRPGFTALVVVTLGLGIGAATAIFTVVDAVLLTPLPYRDPGRLVLIWSRWSNFDRTWISPGEYVDYRRQHDLFQDVATWSDVGEVALTGPDGPPESITAAQASANLLDVLGVVPVAGHMFTAGEDVPNGPAVVMVGYRLWQRRWRGDRGLVGRTIQVDGVPYRVAGILPRDFRLPLEFQSRATAQLIGPIQIDPATAARGSHCCYGVARLQAGVTAARATAALRTLTSGWTDEGLYPRDMRFTAFARSMPEEIGGPVRAPLMVLAAAVGFLLLLTCANVGSLVLARADARTPEVAVRTALGAGGRDMLRLVSSESLLLGGAGGLLGLGLAWATVRLLVLRAPTVLPRVQSLGIDWRVAAFSLVLALATGVLFALVPLVRIRRLDLAGALRDGRGQSDDLARRRRRGVLIVVETAVAALLLIGAGLTVRTFINLSRIDPGFDAHHVLTLRLALPETKYGTVERANTFYATLGDAVRHLPGVDAAGFVRLLPLATEMGDAGLRIQGRPVPPGQQGRQADWQAVSPGYFEAMKIPLVSGRYFDARDRYDGEQVIAINQELAREYFPGEDPLGQRIQLGRDSTPWRRVVAVVGDVRHNGLLGPRKRGWYIPQNQWGRSYGFPRLAMTLVVRTTGDPMTLLSPIRGLVRNLDPDLPLTDVQTMSAVLAAATQEQRFTMAVMGAFALLALTLAAIGLYGVIAYAVSRRTREIGIRLALGSDARRIRAMVLSEGMRPAYLGVALGLAGALLLTRFLRSLLYQVAPIDGPVFVLVALALLLVAALAVLVPAARASRVEPVEALRAE
jgi:putative ABC transport system permease protein